MFGILNNAEKYNSYSNHCKIFNAINVKLDFHKFNNKYFNINKAFLKCKQSENLKIFTKIF